MTPDVPPEPAAEESLPPIPWGTSLGRFKPPFASFAGQWLLGAVLVAAGVVACAFCLREAAVMPGNVPMGDGGVLDRLVRGVMPCLLGGIVIYFGVGELREALAARRSWVELFEGGIRRETAFGVEELPWRRVQFVVGYLSRSDPASPARACRSVEIHFKHSDKLSVGVSSVGDFPRFHQLLLNRTTAAGIEWRFILWGA